MELGSFSSWLRWSLFPIPAVVCQCRHALCVCVDIQWWHLRACGLLATLQPLLGSSDHLALVLSVQTLSHSRPHANKVPRSLCAPAISLGLPVPQRVVPCCHGPGLLNFFATQWIVSIPSPLTSQLQLWGKTPLQSLPFLE